METNRSKLLIIDDILPSKYFNKIKSLDIIDSDIDDEDERDKKPFLIKEPPIKIYDKIVYQRRNVGFFSNKSIGYKYSNKLMKSQKLRKWMKKILDIVNEKLDTKFNGILINHYENGNKCIGAHSDDESGLDNKNNCVASLSIGEERKFRIRDKKTKKIIKDFKTKNNSLIVMCGDFQKEFLHEIPIEKKIKKPRWSLTFRNHIE